MNRLIFSQYKSILKRFSKTYSTKCFYNETYAVNPFCSLFISCPFNVQIRPLNVVKYPNCDKLIIKLYSQLQDNKSKITLFQDNLNVNIFGETEDDNVNCIIETPVKADVNIVAAKEANVDIERINGEKIIIETETGNITANNCQTQKAAFTTLGGQITSNGILQASEVELSTKSNAKILVNHLQALKATVITENGDIIIKSSYCDDTTFQTKCGKLFLDNIHKNCSIIIIKNGSLQMTGFDGTLNADIMEGDIDIQASRFHDLSKITTRNKSKLLLRLSDWIQENTQIKTACQELKVSKKLKLGFENKDVYSILTPKNLKFTSALEIDANLSYVLFEEASWTDMIKGNIIKT